MFEPVTSMKLSFLIDYFAGQEVIKLVSKKKKKKLSSWALYLYHITEFGVFDKN